MAMIPSKWRVEHSNPSGLELFSGDAMQPTMKKMRFLICCCLLVFLTGCLESKNTLSDPNKDETDESLIGEWSTFQVAADGKTTEHVCIIAMPSSGDGLPKGVMVMITGERPNQPGPLDWLHGPTYIIPTTIGDTHYYSMAIPDNTWKPEMGWKPGQFKCYGIVKYKVKGNTLIEYEFNAQKRLKAAIKRGDVRGTTDEGNSNLITEPTEGLRKYVNDNESWLFTEKHEMTKR